MLHHAVIAEHLGLPAPGCEPGCSRMSSASVSRGKPLSAPKPQMKAPNLRPCSPSCFLVKMLWSSSPPSAPSLLVQELPPPPISPFHLPKCSTLCRDGKTPTRLDLPLSCWLRMEPPQKLPVTIAWLQMWSTGPSLGKKGSRLLPGGLLWVAAWWGWKARQCFFP